MIVRTYALTAADGRADELRTALLQLAVRVRELAGAVRVDVLRDQKTPGIYLFVETWVTDSAAAAGGKDLGRDAFAPILAAVTLPPLSAQYDQVA